MDPQTIITRLVIVALIIGVGWFLSWLVSGGSENQGGRIVFYLAVVAGALYGIFYIILPLVSHADHATGSPTGSVLMMLATGGMCGITMYR